MKIEKLLVVFVLLSAFITGCNSSTGSSHPSSESTSNEKDISHEKTGAEITVSGAASLTDALTKVVHQYEKQSNTKVYTNFASSGKLEKQIEQGAPTDVFLSASKTKMNNLVKRDLVDQQHLTDLLKNKLVLIVPKHSNKNIQSFTDLKKNTVHKLAVGIPSSAPAGRYAKETLQTLHLWKSLQNKIVQSNDVRQVLHYVESGNVDAGIVYKSDALISDKVKVAATAKPSSHTPIIYPAAVIAGTKYKEAATDFYKYLHTKEAIKIFGQYGFTPIQQ